MMILSKPTILNTIIKEVSDIARRYKWKNLLQNPKTLIFVKIVTPVSMVIIVQTAVSSSKNFKDHLSF